MRQGRNKCSWLIVDEKRRCEVSCVYEFCKHHRAKVRTGITEPTPCSKCGTGTRTACHLCQKCGAHLLTQNLINIEKRSIKRFNSVFAELLRVRAMY